MRGRRGHSLQACRAFGMSPRTWNHRRQAAEGRLPPRPSRASGRPRKLPEWTLPEAERDEVRAVLCEERFVDLAPAQVYATLLDEGRYLCSISTMYRILHEYDLVVERRRGHHRHGHGAPVVEATGPNQAWSWDISRLRGPAPRSWFSLYVVLDIYSRKIVGWSVDVVESDAVAQRLVRRACEREGVDPDTLTLHPDRGAQMTSTTMAELLEDLGVTRSLSRPRTSNDNPYSEANFKTASTVPTTPTASRASRRPGPGCDASSHPTTPSTTTRASPTCTPLTSTPAPQPLSSTPAKKSSTRPTPSTRPGFATGHPVSRRRQPRPGSTARPSKRSPEAIGNQGLTASSPRVSGLS